MDYRRYESLKIEKDGQVAILTLNRPEALNAINPQFHTEPEDIFADVAQDDRVNAVVLTGAAWLAWCCQETQYIRRCDCLLAKSIDNQTTLTILLQLPTVSGSAKDGDYPEVTIGRIVGRDSPN